MKKVFVKVIMQDIELRNCAGLCSHQFCGSPYEKFCNLTLNSMPLHLALRPTFQSIIFDTLKFFTCFFFFLDYLVYFLPVLIVTICKKHTKAEAAEFARQYKEYCKEQEAVDKEYCKEQEGIK